MPHFWGGLIKILDASNGKLWGYLHCTVQCAVELPSVALNEGMWIPMEVYLHLCSQYGYTVLSTQVSSLF